ncbi:MAG: Phosphoribosylaminoimidazole-succinocarboxamide synthase [Methanobacterium sp. PtaU1.Bin242]|nr:MAG: Phosphoribosylaminoimidazole-succinocarboxamide synthase [Methanobacterium sp. PtaU1.Bin242]
MTPHIGDLIYQGKAKDVYQTDDPEMVLVKFRDDITAGDGEKKDKLVKKGYYNSIISAKFFEILEAAGVKTQYIKLLNPGMMLSRKLEMIPLEIITRNIAAGSLIRKFPFQERQEFKPPIIQMDYKSDEYHDPMLNDDIAVALGFTTRSELETIRKTTLKINQILKDFLEDNEDEIRDIICERDDSDAISDLIRNTSDPIMFYDLCVDIDECGYDSQMVKDNIRAIKKALGIPQK